MKVLKLSDIPELLGFKSWGEPYCNFCGFVIETQNAFQFMKDMAQHQKEKHPEKFSRIVEETDKRSFDI
jgi:predicted small metal-binding protein